MRTTFIERIFQRHFGARAESIVENLASSPQMEAVLAEMDAAQVERRRELVAQLNSAPQRHEARCREAGAAQAKAAQVVADARAAVEVAMARHMEAASTSVSLSTRYQLERASLERELERTADPRIELFAQGCIDLSMTLRHYSPKESIQFNANIGGRLTSDYTDLNAAMSALSVAAKGARALKLQALTFAQITERLEALRRELRPLLEAAGYRTEPPAADGGDAVALALH